MLTSNNWVDLNEWTIGSLVIGVSVYKKTHVVINDATRRACADVLLAEKPANTFGFLIRAEFWLEIQGINSRRVLSDNGNAHPPCRFGRPMNLSA